MNTITIHMKLFGAFRQFGDSLNFSVPAGSSITIVKDALVHALGDQEKSLVTASALANDNAILPENSIFDSNARLSILPPVCGG